MYHEQKLLLLLVPHDACVREGWGVSSHWYRHSCLRHPRSEVRMCGRSQRRSAGLTAVRYDLTISHEVMRRWRRIGHTASLFSFLVVRREVRLSFSPVVRLVTQGTN